jgi:NADH-quinone oxidoreductase subunit M
MLATILVGLPLAAALLLWASPWLQRAAPQVALAAASAQVGLWIGVLAGFDFGATGLRDELDVVWFGDLGVSYKVGLYDWTLWLVGLVALATLAAVVFALHAERGRPRAYFGLLLFLEAATTGVFVAQDLLLFYVFFEAMMIPLYVLVGVWGGERRIQATLRLVIYTLAGSLLMLVSIVAFGLEQGTFELTAMGTSSSTWIFLGFAAAFAVKAPVWPFHGWLPDAYRQAPVEVSALLSGVISKTAAYGFLLIVLPHFPEPVSEQRDVVLALAAIGLVYSSLVAYRAPDLRGIVAYSSVAQMCLITIGVFAANDSGIDGSLLQMVNHGLVSTALFLLAGGVELRCGTGELARLGGMARGRPILATLVITVGVIAVAVPGSSVFAGEFLILNGVFTHGWGWAVVGAIAIVLAALYGLRLISAVLHRDRGPAVTDAQPDLRPIELGAILPLVAALLALSFWPAAITDNSFDGEPVQAVSVNYGE